MLTLNSILNFLATLISLYSFMCVIRIFLTWIPGLPYNVVSFFSKICDPYLNFFSKRGLFRFGAIDFSPILSFGVLAIISTLLKSIATSGSISLALILILIIQMIWNVISSILIFFLIFLIIRFIILLIQKNSYSGSNIWRQIDYAINPIVYKIANTFSTGKVIPYKTAILISIICIFLIILCGSFLFGQLIHLISYIPF